MYINLNTIQGSSYVSQSKRRNKKSILNFLKDGVVRFQRWELPLDVLKWLACLRNIFEKKSMQAEEWQQCQNEIEQAKNLKLITNASEN